MSAGAVAAGAVPTVAGTDGQPDRAPAYLVCAHSKHDTCCALRGRPVAAALADQRPGHVWECSHVGGERFAANVLVLPLGMMYGRVLPFAAAEFAAAADEGRVIDALLRGRIGLMPVVQAALAFTHAQLAIFEALICLDCIYLQQRGAVACDATIGEQYQGDVEEAAAGNAYGDPFAAQLCQPVDGGVTAIKHPDRFI